MGTANNKGTAAVLVVVTAGLALALAGCDRLQHVPTGPTPLELTDRDQTASLLFEGEMVVFLSEAEIAKLPADFAQRAATLGWERTSSGFHRIVPLRNIELLLNGRPYRTDDAGRIEQGPEQPLQFELASGNPVPATETAERDGARVYRFIATFDQLEHDHTPGTALNSRQTMNDWGVPKRCLDFNGWYAEYCPDGWCNYPKSDWKAYRNFVASDCDRAAYRCFWEHGPWKVADCWYVHGAQICSNLVGHSSQYHKHYWPH